MADPRFLTGAYPTPRHILMGAIPHRVIEAPPAQIARVPQWLSMWGNAQYGCHDDQTEVLTEHGWKRWADYDGASLLGTVNTATLLLEFQAPEWLIRYDYDGLLAYGTHKGQDFALTPNHRLFLRNYHIAKNGREYIPGTSGYGPYQFRTVDKAPTRFLIPGAPSGFLGTRLDKLTIGSRQWDGTDFLRLLALVISDGYAASGETNRQRVGFCCFREDRLDMVRSFAAKLGIREERSRPGVWVMGDLPLADWLRSNIYVGEEKRSPFKKVPDLVKVASQEQIEEFLRFYGDQSFCNGRDFYTSSRFLADDLQELLMRTGKRANIHERQPRPGGMSKDGCWIEGKHPSFELHVWEDSDVGMLGPNKAKATLAFEHYRGEVFCATVPNSTLITRRNGSVLISGNCCVTSEECFAKACFDPEIRIPEQTAIAWADRHGVLNGADLHSVLGQMQHDGFMIGQQQYNDGAASGVDWSNELVLQSAIAQGPVKLGIDHNCLPHTAGNQQGWYAVGPQRGGNLDHCTSLSSYGTAGYLYDALKVNLPSALHQDLQGHLLFTWGTQGFVDHAWIVSACGEAWVRNPTTVGVPPLPGPAPGPGPAPTPTPPGPTPAADIFTQTVRNGFKKGQRYRENVVFTALNDGPPGTYRFGPAAAGAEASVETATVEKARPAPRRR